MIKAILLAAFVPFLTQHRNITPSNEVSTCFYGSVTGIVDNAYIAAHGGGSGGVTAQQATNIASAVVAPATNALESSMLTLINERATTNDLAALSAETMKRSGNNYIDRSFYLFDADYPSVPLFFYDLGNDWYVGQNVKVKWSSIWDTPTTLSGYGITDALAKETASWQDYGPYKYLEVPALLSQHFVAVEGEVILTGSGFSQIRDTDAGLGYFQTLPQFIESNAITNGGAKAYAEATFLPKIGSDDANIILKSLTLTNDESKIEFGGFDSEILIGSCPLKMGNNNETSMQALNLFDVELGETHKIINFDNAWKVRFISDDGETFSDFYPDGSVVATSNMLNSIVPQFITHTNPTFSNEVLAVGFGVSSNDVAVIREMVGTIGELPIGGGAATLGGLLAALVASIVWLKSNALRKGLTGGVPDDPNVSALFTSANTSNNAENVRVSAADATPMKTYTDGMAKYPIVDYTAATGILDRTINVVGSAVASVEVPENFTDLIIRADVASSLAVTVPAAITQKYGDAFPSAAGNYVVTITKLSATEALVKTIKLEAQS